MAPMINLKKIDDASDQPWLWRTVTVQLPAIATGQSRKLSLRARLGCVGVELALANEHRRH